MLNDKAVPLSRAVVNSVCVVVCAACGKDVAVLPEEVAGHSLSVQRGSLPWSFDCDVVGWEA